MTTWRTRAKRALGVPWRLARAMRRPRARWVVTFHEVGDHPWGVTPRRFREHLDAIASAATLVSLEALVAGGDDGGLRVAVTFDDGYAGVARHARDALSAAGAPATVFVPTDLLPDEDGPARAERGLYAGADVLGWRTVRDLARRSPFTFESHGAAHAPLPSLAPEARRADLDRSRAALLAATGRSPRFLAYPFGAADEASAAAARDAGFEAAFTTRHGGVASGADPHRLPRVDVRADYAPRDVVAALHGDWDFLAARHALRGSRA